MSNDVKVLCVLDKDVRMANADGMLYLLTACCKASAKGSGDGVVCRACYRPIPDWMGWATMTSDAESAVESVTDLLREHGGVLSQLLGTIPMTVVLTARQNAGQQA